MRRPRWWVAAVGTLTVASFSACTSAPAGEPDRPAVLQESDANTRAAVSAAVTEMLKGTEVTLVEDVLLHDSWLTVERTRPRTATGQLLNGRVLERPEQFQLVKRENQCVLVHQGSGNRKVLESIACIDAATQ